MARALRLEFSGALYHVTARGNERRALFRDDADRRDYLDLLARCRQKFGFQLAFHTAAPTPHPVSKSGLTPTCSPVLDRAEA